MLSDEKIKSKLFAQIANLLDDQFVTVVDTMPLIGSGSVLNSMKLVELCLSLEDLATELGFDFDWTSDVAMSRSRSMFRTAGSLADEFIHQMGLKK